jgi:hypothetical protein
MPAFERNLYVSQDTPNNNLTIHFCPPPELCPQPFVAWGAITWIDPRVGAFDVNNAIGFDIPQYLDDTGTLKDTQRVFFGGHLHPLGPDGDINNLRKSSIVAHGIGVVFRLRIYPQAIPELACVANCVVITNP